MKDFPMEIDGGYVILSDGFFHGEPYVVDEVTEDDVQVYFYEIDITSRYKRI
jgi:hypothetical protein